MDLTFGQFLYFLAVIYGPLIGLIFWSRNKELWRSQLRKAMFGAMIGTLIGYALVHITFRGWISTIMASTWGSYMWWVFGEEVRNNVRKWYESRFG